MMVVGSESDWNIVFKLFMMETNPQERQKLMTSLTMITNITILNE